MAGEEVKLFRTWSSQFALRVVWALKLKGVEYDTVYEDLSNKSSLLLRYNPVHKKVPVLLHNGRPVAESLVILEYVEETWKQNPLLPEDLHGRAVARFWAKFGDDKLVPSVWNVFMKQGKEQEEAVASAQESLRFLDEVLEGKKFFGGDKIGFVDLALGWLANLNSVFEEITNLTIIDNERFPRFSAWMVDFANDPIIKQNLPPRYKLVAKFQVIRDSILATAVAPK